MQNRIKELRKELGLNQTEFGEKLGAKQATVAGWEVGRREPSHLVINTICREFNVNEHWLRNGEGPMFRPVKTIDNELTIEIAKLIKSEDEFTKHCVLQYLRLSDETKAMFKTFLTSVVEGYKTKNE